MLHYQASVHTYQFHVRLPVVLLVALVTLAATGANRSAWGGEMTPRAARVIDVKLGSENELRGQITDVAGQSIENAPLVLLQNGKVTASTTADGEGRFHFGELRGGVYVVATPGTALVCRAWSANVAPPAAAPRVLIIADGEIVRGQSFRSTSFYEWLEMHPIVGYTGLTAIIAVPIIVTAANDSDDAS